MERRSPFALALALLTTNVHAQDSTRYIGGGDLHVSGMGGLIVQVGSMDLGDQVFTSVGGGGGVLIGQRFMLGGYGQGLSNMGVHRDFTVGAVTHEATLNFGYGGPWVMWSFSPKRPVHPFLSLQAGWGAAEWNFDDPYDHDEAPVADSLRAPANKGDQVFVLSPSAGVELNMTRWFRPNLYVGYRFVNGLSLDGTGSGDLDGYFFGLNLLFGGFGERK